MVTAARSVLVRRSAERFTTVGDRVRTRHLLSFGDHYDPALTSLGPLIAHNDEVVEPGAGYATHRHRGVEIVTWVVAGRLIHRDPSGEAVLGPGSAQLLSAGRGVLHEEMAGPTCTGEPARFVQMWLRSDDPDAEPRYTIAQFDAHDLRARLVPIAAGAATLSARGQPSPLVLGVRGAVCLAGRLAAGSTRALPAAGATHLFVVAGDVSLSGRELGEVRLTAGDSAVVTGVARAACVSVADAEIVAWAWNLDSTAQEPP